MRSRFAAAAACMMAVFSVLTAHLAMIAADPQYAAAARAQSEETLLLDEGRGNFYDCNWTRLTGAQYVEYGLFSPGRESYSEWFGAVDGAERAAFYENVQSLAPFLLPLDKDSERPQYVFRKTQRYMTMPIAEHLIGYLDGEGTGVSGLEAAFDGLLEGAYTRQSVWCAANAVGAVITDGRAQPHEVKTLGTGAGVMLTLDARIQRICESIAADMIDKGCIVVLESRTGRVRASVSAPSFDPTDVAASIERDDTSLINRPVSAFNVGSVFKPLLAAAALEAGVSPEQTYECTGAIEVNGHVYRCAYGRGHGTVDMRTALEQSCNCYFIRLGLSLGAQRVYEAAAAAGFGRASTIAGSWRTAAGSLPSQEELEDLGQLASVSFGQGALTATPLQVAAFMNIFANEGRYIEPTFVEGIVDAYRRQVSESLYAPVQTQAFSAAAAEQVRAMLAGVVENGLGQPAQPAMTTAGGKTGTAQTGRYGEDGEEKLDAWFAGFYPADAPRYTIAVLLDDSAHSSTDAAEVFAAVAAGLYCFEGCPEEDAGAQNGAAAS